MLEAAIPNAGDGGGKPTFYAVICCIFAASGGLLMGYDIGVSGGVTAMEEFSEKFFPEVYRRQHGGGATVVYDDEDNYCKYDNQQLQLFTSSLYLACLLASFVASKICTDYGRKVTIQLASLLYFVGVVLSSGALNFTMLISGRLLVGMGDGFVIQAVPLLISEIAPPKNRGTLNILFQFNITIGILLAKTVNYFAANLHPWGWRVSLGFAGILAVNLFLGSLVITDTPTSLIERGRLDEGLAALQKLRGAAENVGDEYSKSLKLAAPAKWPFLRLTKRSGRPELVISLAIQVFTQLTGINVIMFYAPVLFETVGFKTGASLLSTVIVGGINVLATIVSIVLVDRAGRRVLLLQACLQMLITQSAIGGILMVKLKTNDNTLDRSMGILVVILVCMYVMSFAWSWGSMCSLIPSEIFPAETRSAGMCCAITTSMIITFLIAQGFLSMLCRLKAATFFFFAAWTAAGGLFVLFLLPETKGVPIDEMAGRVWSRHWFWKRYLPPLAGKGSDIDDLQATTTVGR